MKKRRSKLILIIITILICISSITTINFVGKRISTKEVKAISSDEYKGLQDNNSNVTKSEDNGNEKEFLDIFKEFDLNLEAPKDDNFLQEIKKHIEEIKNIEVLKELKITFNKINMNVREFFQFVDEFIK
ncbi:hypothetical protein [Clostridium faecium]|uniref:Lipoprotein n=1 Tax=Clostridium faecium TaxID=2762223 RepID=A0ABR8YUS1_9CLOT|nr:hypothetical protein [Clostridium faecium]MBD8047999.1 hypothetical protein [Clostridium faecium]MDU1351046.1 hypothetical protein [Clostridium argentinense]